MNYCGIDLADKASTVSAIDQQGKMLRQEVVETTEVGLQRGVAALGPVKVVVEACPLAEWAARTLEGAGCEVDIIDPRAAKHMVSSKKKTDARDARTLAQLARSGWYTRVHRKSAEARLERSRLQGRSALMRTKKALSSAIRGLLKAQGIKLGKVSEGEFADKVRNIVSAQLPGLAETFEQLLLTWQQALEGSAQLEKSITRANRENATCQRLQSVPGVGPLISTAYVATIDDPSRFHNGDQVADYLGLVPRVYQSGEVEYHGRITKEGDGLLRWHLVEAANVLLTKGRDCALKRWGLGLEQRKGGAKARIAVARKLAVLLWRLWTTGETFQPWPSGRPPQPAAA